MLEGASETVPQMDDGTQVYKFGCDWPSELEGNSAVQSQECWGIADNKLRVWTQTFNG